MKLIIPISLLSLLVLMTSLNKNDSKPFRPYKNHVPPGTIEIDSNLYMDDTEITNFHWLEFLYWTGNVYGKESKEYKQCIPDQELWKEEEKCLNYYNGNYLRNPAYRDYPVVGITQNQAREFLEWRSNRVFEYILIKNKVIDRNVDIDSNNQFTIEKYFEGQYTSGVPDPKFTYYPSYRLPTEKEWKKGESFFRFKNKEKKCRDKKCTIHIGENETYHQVNISTCFEDSLHVEPMLPTSHNKRGSKGIHMIGNAAEWLYETNRATGGSWKQLDNDSGPFSVDSARVNIGFRGVCEWKLYEKSE